MTTKGPQQLFGLPLTRALGLMLVPLLIAGVFLWGLWDPTSRMNHVTAAVVNNDEPVEVDGQLTPLGRVLAAELIGATESENFTWSLTNDEGAAEGLETGEYVSVVTIPENFSQAATSLADGPDNAEQATISVHTSERAKLLDAALSAAVTETATQVLNEQLGEAFIGNVFVGFNELGEGLDEASDGAGELADGTRTLADGTGQLADGTDELAEGAGGLADGAGQLAAGADELAAGAGGLASGVGELANGASQLEEGTGALAGGAVALAQGLEEYAAGVEELADGTEEAAAGSYELAAGISEYVTNINQPLGVVQTELENFLELVENSQLPGDLKEEIREALKPIIEDLSKLIGGGEGLEAVSKMSADGLQELAVGARDLAGGAYGLAGGAHELSGGAQELATQIPGLTSGVRQLADGAYQLADGAQQAAAGTHELASGSTELAAGAEGLAQGTRELADGGEELADGADELAQGLAEAVQEIPRYNKEERDTLSSLAVKPVTSGADDRGLFAGTGAPLFLTIALWAGALASFMLISPLWPRTREAALSEATITLRSAVPSLCIGALQGLLAGVLVAAVLQEGSGATLGYLSTGTLAGVSFSLVNQGLVSLLGGVGRFLSFLILIIAFVAGIVSTVPGTLGTITGFTPVGAGMSALFNIAERGVPGLGAIMMLLVWGAIGFILLGGAVHRIRKPR